jgi:hypothetical protein
MQVRLTPAELLNIAGISAEALKSMRRRGQIAIGLSGDDIAASRMYVRLDALASMLSSTLARTFGAPRCAEYT